MTRFRYLSLKQGTLRHLHWIPCFQKTQITLRSKTAHKYCDSVTFLCCFMFVFTLDMKLHKTKVPILPLTVFYLLCVSK